MPVEQPPTASVQPVHTCAQPAEASLAEDERIMRLLAQADACPSGRCFPEDVQRWLQEGLRAHLDSGGAIALDKALGLRVVAGPSYTRRLAYAKRVAAWVEVIRAADGAVTPWRRCAILAVEIEDFASRFWEQWKEIEAPPAGSSALRRSLFALFKTYAVSGLCPPKTDRAIYAALTRAGLLT